MKTRAEFVQHFLLPLVEGGEVHVGAPLGAAALERFLDAAPGQIDRDDEARLCDVRWALAGELQMAPIPPRLDEETFRLAVAVHDMLFLFHPSAGGPASRSDKVRAVAQGAASLARLPRTADADRLVARHTVLHLLPSLSRSDVRISFWVGKREFHGQEPPTRLSAWPRLRRVHEERWRVGCLGEAASDAGGGAEVVRALLTSSPLTDLFTPVRLDPRLDFSSLSSVLVEPEVCRMVAYRWLDDGLENVGGAVAQALLTLLSARHSPGLALSLSLLAHLHLCLLFSTERADAQAPDAIVRRLTGRGEALQRDFCGLFSALRAVSLELCAPADVRADPRLARRIAEHAEACALACGAPRLRELTALVGRALGLIDAAAA